MSDGKRFNPETDCVGSQNGFCVENAPGGCATRCFDGAIKFEVPAGATPAQLKFLIESLFSIRDMTEPEQPDND